MADSFIQVAPDSTGKMMQTYLNTIGGNPVHAEVVSLVDTSGNPITTLNVNIGTPTINATFAGTINVAQSNASNLAATVSQGGTWNIGVVTSITNPVTAQQSNASNFLATVSGTVTANQGGTWNIGTITTLPANSSFNLSQVGGSAATTNAGNAAAGTQRVILATDQPNVPVTLQNAPNIGLQVLTGARAGIATGQVTMSNVATQIVGARATRRSITIRNHDTTNSGYIGAAAVATANGILLLPYDSISVDFTGVVQGISATTSNVTFGYLESFD